MAYEVESAASAVVRLIIEFLREATIAMDSNVPIPRRLAIAVKWQNVLRGMGYKPERKLTLSSSEDDVIRELERMLEYVTVILRENV